MANYDCDENRRLVFNGGRDVLERTSASISRSNQIALETEHVGTEVLSELGQQRESLLRNQRRLENANDNLSKSHAALRAFRTNVIYNKLILILIIVLEASILSGLLFLKFQK